MATDVLHAQLSTLRAAIPSEGGQAHWFREERIEELREEAEAYKKARRQEKKAAGRAAPYRPLERS